MEKWNCDLVGGPLFEIVGPHQFAGPQIEHLINSCFLNAFETSFVRLYALALTNDLRMCDASLAEFNEVLQDSALQNALASKQRAVLLINKAAWGDIVDQSPLAVSWLALAPKDHSATHMAGQGKPQSI